MENVDSWILLRGNEGERKMGLLQNQQKYTQYQNGSNTMSLGISYLWLYQYQLAWEHFRRAILTRGAKGDAYFGMAGVAMWCLGRPSEAVAEWRAGLKANYSRSGGLNIRIPLLLYFASVVKPEVFEHTSARELMLKKTGDRRMKNWPGPMARWLLGQITEEDFQSQCNGTDAANVLDHQWLASFYRSALRSEPSKTSEFKESMWRLTDMSGPEWLDQDYFLSRVWSEEFFLARYEAKRTEPCKPTSGT